MRFQIIELEAHGKPTLRIVNENGEMIAKVNGPGNRSVCETLCNAYEESEKLKALLRNRLVDLLKDVKGSGLLAFSLRRAFEQKASVDKIIKELKEQVQGGAGYALVTTLGGEAVQILQVI